MTKWRLSLRAWATSLALAILTANVAHADDPLPDVEGVCAPEVSVRRASVSHEGEPGIWFQMDVARCMLGRLAALPLYAQRVSLLEQRLQLSDERHLILRDALDIGASIETRYDLALQDAITRAREAEEAADKWYRSPTLWLVLGAVVGGALVGLGAYALGQLP